MAGIAAPCETAEVATERRGDAGSRTTDALLRSRGTRTRRRVAFCTMKFEAKGCADALPDQHGEALALSDQAQQAAEMLGKPRG